MKKHAFFIVMAAGLLASCSGSDKESASTSDTAEASEEVSGNDADSIPAVANIPFEVKKFEKTQGEDELGIDYPVSGNPEVVDSVRTWMNQSLNESFHGDLSDPEAFFRHYAAMLGEDEELAEFGGFTKDDFKLSYVNDYIVTYNYDSYIYEGGAHGMGGSYGTTFLQNDGKMFTKDCFTSFAPLKKYFVEGLKSYFNVKSDAQLKDCLISDCSISDIDVPGRNPWITAEGVVFSYSPYEIAPYSAGTPHFTIPVSEIEPYLTPEGKKFFGK